MSWTDEIWKITYLNGNQIMVSSFGRIMGFSGRILKPQITGNGYLAIKYWNGEYISSKLIHRIVAEAFIPNPKGKPEVDHIDTDRTNNHVDNLRWVTRSENFKNPLTVKKKSKLMTGRLISEETRRKMSESHKGKGGRPVVMFDSSGVFIEEFKTVTDACEKLKFRKEDVYRCLSRKSRNYKNLIFKYKEDLL
jgi:hypothetical protein